ncbi:response regulator [candidate division KSB1 bacterium]|nr:response regulator [candidate division KSB1 bacterium]
MRILVIDDSAASCWFISDCLGGAGHEVFEAENGKEGIKIFKRIHCDLVITDIIMPEMEGIETIRALRKIDPAIKIIAISGGGKQSAQDYLNIASALGANLTLQKPITQEQLLCAIEIVNVEKGECK